VYYIDMNTTQTTKERAGAVVISALQGLQTQYLDEQHSADALVDEQTRNLQALVRAAATLTPSAQAQFCQYFVLDFALDGQLYVRRGAHQRAAAHLMAEAAAAGIVVVG